MPSTQLIGAAVGTSLLFLGLAAVVAWGLRRRSADRILLFFGIWCALYGARLIAEQPAIVAAPGGSGRGWAYFRAFATYTINIPIGLFIEAAIGRGWRGTVRFAWKLFVVSAVASAAIDLVLDRPGAARWVNSPVVLVALAIAAVNLWTLRRRLGETFTTPLVGTAAMLMGLLVVNENLGRPFVPDVNLEPLGVFAFVLSLGYGVAGRVFRQETELAAMRRELETASRIQTALLPRCVPPTSGLDVAARHVPMTAVAGDLYDFVPLGPSRLGVLVADVCGHGVPAALVASMVKVALSAHAADAGDPAALLGALNRTLCGHLDGTFVTAVYAVIDTGAGRLVASHAGHPAALVGRANREVDECGGGGVMLGVLPEASYSNGALDLGDGDRILLYTDGIPEARSPAGEFLDFVRVRQWLADTEDSAAARMADQVIGRLREWRGGAAFEDDVTFVVARVGA